MRATPLILLVDDEDTFLEIEEMKLRGKGFVTEKTDNAEAALAKAEALLPDLILSDIYMPPGPNGWQLAIELHRNPKTQHMKVVFLTSLRDPWIEIPPEAREAVSEELGKPVFLSKADDLERLGEKLQSFLS